LISLIQKIDESPNDFYIKIRYLVNLAEYDDGVQEMVAEQIFMKGVHGEIAYTLRTTTTTLDITAKIAYAQRIWAAKMPDNMDILTTQYTSSSTVNPLPPAFTQFLSSPALFTPVAIPATLIATNPERKQEIKK